MRASPSIQGSQIAKLKELGRRHHRINLSHLCSSCLFGLAMSSATPSFNWLARFVCALFSIAIVLVGAQVLNARFIGIALGGRTALVGAQVLIARFISIAFGRRMALVDVPRFNRIAFLAA